MNRMICNVIDQIWLLVVIVKINGIIVEIEIKFDQIFVVKNLINKKIIKIIVYIIIIIIYVE